MSDHVHHRPGHGNSEEFTPRELGLLAGHFSAGFQSPKQRKRIADEQLVPDDLKDAVMRAGLHARMLDFDDPDAAEDAFWRGFVHGVRAFIVEEDLVQTANSN